MIKLLLRFDIEKFLSFGYFSNIPQKQLFGASQPAWSAIFHSISAFCTAGFSLYDDSFEQFKFHSGINGILAVLSFAGGIGFIVLTDLWEKIKNIHYKITFTSKIILVVTLLLSTAGTLYIVLLYKHQRNPVQDDLVLLDLGLPDLDGISILKQFREWSQVPVIVLTVQDVVYTKVLALDSGADDYITKPFNTSELLARIRVAIRHSLRMDEAPVFTSGHLFVDLNARLVKINNEEIKLTATEYSILALFVKHAGKVLTHSFIMNEIWGKMYAESFQILRVHITQLRKKIEKNPSMPELLISEPGVGYRFREL